MTEDDEYYNKTLIKPKTLNHLEDENQGDDGDESSGSQGGRSGQVEFHDFLSPGGSREDLLSYDEKKHLLLIHKDGNEIRLKKAKDLIADRLKIKEKVGKFLHSVYEYGKSFAQGAHNQYKPNPALHDKAQFSGVDKQVSPDSTINDAITNEAERQEPENEYRKRFTPELTPHFRPTPTVNKLTRS
jgi:hypothetical protein